MLAGIYTPDINTYSGSNIWISNNVAKDQHPVCLVCCSGAMVVSVSDDSGSTWTTLASTALSTMPFDWIFYVTKPGTWVQTAGAGFLRVQGVLVDKP